MILKRSRKSLYLAMFYAVAAACLTGATSYAAPQAVERLELWWPEGERVLIIDCRPFFQAPTGTYGNNDPLPWGGRRIIQRGRCYAA
jgi:hypothetical protein